MKNQLTDRQEEILKFIDQFITEMHYAPSIREIARQFGISSTNGVKRHLEALVKKGFLKIEENTSRAISLIKQEGSDNELSSSLETDINRIPIVGRVAAGSPIMAEQNLEGSIVMDSSFTKKAKSSFALKVKGDSMINAGIFEGDLVIVSGQSEAVNGDIVVAMLENEVTVKTFQNKNNRILLIPENEKYSPIEVTGEKEFTIIGKVVGVVRYIN
jgi:repressor LexA